MVTFHCMFCGVKYFTAGIVACAICGQTLASGWLVEVPLEQAPMRPVPIATERRGGDAVRLVSVHTRGHRHERGHTHEHMSPSQLRHTHALPHAA